MNGKIKSAITNINLNEATFHGENFQPNYINFLFGNNGSGKSTIGKVIKKANTLGWELHANPDDYDIYLYNEDFIKRNIESYDDLPGVFTMNEENITIQHQIESTSAELKKAEDIYTDFSIKYTEKYNEIEKARSHFDELCWEKSESTRKKLGPAVVNRRNKNAFSQSLIEEVDLNCKDEKTLLAMCNAAFDSSSETYSELKIIEIVGSPITDLLTEMITSSSDSPFADFIKTIKATQWVRKGHEEYHGKTDGKCPYCQQGLPTNFEEEITKCFDEEYQNKINEIKNFKSAYNKMANDVISMLNKNLKSEFPNSEEELKKYTEKSDLLKTKLQLNIGSIDTKISNHVSIVELEAIDGLISEVNNLAVSINNQIRAHNEIINNKKNNQPLCKEETVKFITNMLKDEIELYKDTSLKLNDELEHIREEKDKAYDETSRLRKEISNLNKSVVNTTEAADGINKTLRDSGFLDFFIRPKNSTSNVYEVIRSSTNCIAEQLSEGERYFISFLYFYQLIQGNKSADSEPKKKIVVIDDPVSSMDSSTMFIVVSLIRDLIDICNPDYITKIGKSDNIEQIFILTHNAYFHHQITLKQADNFEYVSFYEVNKKDNMSTIKLYTKRHPEMPSKIINHNPVQNSYAALWNAYTEVDSSYALINIIRQILNYYFIELMGLDGSDIADVILKSHRDKFVRIKSDGTEDTSDLNTAMTLLQYVKSSNSTVADGFNFIPTSIEVDSCREIFKKSLKTWGKFLIII